MLSVETSSALARALKVNRTLRHVELKERAKRLSLKTRASARRACLTLAEILQVNHKIELVVVVPCCVEESNEYKELEIQISLNKLGRGRLLQNESTRANWVEALILAKQPGQVKPDLVLDCLFSLLRLNPLLCQL